MQSRSITAVLFLVAITGCGSAPPTPTSPRAPAKIAAAPAAEVIPADLERVSFSLAGTESTGLTPRVVLLDPGGADRTLLRTHGGNVPMRMKVTMVAQVRARKPNPELDGAAVATLGLEMWSAPKDGLVEVDVKIADAKVEHGEQAHVGGQAMDHVEQLAGATLQFFMTDRGQMIASITSPGADPAAASDVSNALARAIAVPLPAEPVGVGARWRTREVVELSSFLRLASIEETTYELQEIRPNGPIVALSVHATRVALDDGKQPISMSDRDAAARARAAVATKSIEELVRHHDPIGHVEGGAGFVLAAPQFGGYQRTARLEIDGRQRESDPELRIELTDQITIEKLDDTAAAAR